ncbi:MAG: hypothetical protein Q9207_002690 [Kuettlingeria erythrocarpa]
MEQPSPIYPPTVRAVARAFHKIVSLSPTSQPSIKNAFPGGDLGHSGNDISELQRDTSKSFDIPSDTEDMDHPQISTIDDAVAPKDRHPAVGSIYQTIHTGSYVTRQPKSNESPRQNFRFGKPKPFLANTKPTRNTAATVLMPPSTAPQPILAETTRNLLTDHASSGVEAAATSSQEEAHRYKVPRSTSPISEPPVHSSSIPQPSSWLSDPKPDSNPQTRYSTPTETMPDDKSTPSKMLDNAVSQAAAGQQPWSGESQEVVRGEVHNSTEHEEATVIQDASDEEEGGRHDEDTDMLDGTTLIGAVPESPQKVQDTSTSSSFSTERPPIIEQPSGQGHGGGRGQMGKEASEASITATSQRVQKVHERLTTAHDRSPPPATPPCSHVNDNQSMGTEELMKALAVKVRSEKQQQHDMKAREEEREDELRAVGAICQALDRQLRESEHRVSAQEEELAKYRQQIPTWQERVKKLIKFVNGLNNDHGRLRDVAQAIRKEQQDLRVERHTMEKIVENTKATVEHERLQRKEMVLKARYDAEKIEQVMNTKGLDLLKENTRFRAELDRTVTLQKTLALSASSYDALSERLAQQEAAIGLKVQSLCDILQSNISKTSLSGPEDVMSKLQECLALLQESRKEARVLPDDVHNLHSLMAESNTRLSRLTTECGSSIEATAQLGGRLATQLDAQVQKLHAAIEGGHLSNEQITDLKEVKAKIAEQLRASETSLAGYRHKATSLENQEQLHLQKISALEAEVNTIRSQTHESPLMALRLHDSEKHCISMKEQLTACQSQLAAAKAQIDSSNQETSELRDLLEITNGDLTERQARVERLEAEKTAVENQAALNEKRTRAELSRASENNVTSRTAEFRNEIKGLRHAASVTEKELQMERSKLEQLQADKVAASDSVERLQSSVSELQSRATTSEHTISRLEQSIKDARQEGAEKDAHLRGLQAELREVREAATKDNEASRKALLKLHNAEEERLRLENEHSKILAEYDDLKEQLAVASSKSNAQEAQIQDLLNKLAAIKTGSTTSGSSPAHSLNRSRSTERHLAVVEDSQDRVLRQRRGILKRGHVIDDSQEHTGQTHQGSSRALSSDELSRADSRSYVPKDVRDKAIASSSPLTDIRRTASPVIDGASMYPQSPLMGQGNNALGLSCRRSDVTPYHDASSHQESPVPGNSWAYNTTVTSTKTHSVTASITGMSPFSANGAPPRTAAHKSSQSSAIKQSDSQTELHSRQNLKALGSKRPHPGVTGSDDRRKRRRMSSEAEKHGLGPTQISPIKAGSSLRRKTTLRHSQQGKHLGTSPDFEMLTHVDDHMDERFQQELQKRR